MYSDQYTKIVMNFFAIHIDNRPCSLNRTYDVQIKTVKYYIYLISQLYLLVFFYFYFLFSDFFYRFTDNMTVNCSLADLIQKQYAYQHT